jgi:hypothetical protein
MNQTEVILSAAKNLSISPLLLHLPSLLGTPSLQAWPSLDQKESGL